MTEQLSLQQIKEMYPDEWVLLTDFTKEGVEIMGGKVLMHDKDKRNLAQRAQHESFPDTPKTVYFTGQLPKRRGRVGLLAKQPGRLEMVAHLKGSLPNRPSSKSDHYQQ